MIEYIIFLFILLGVSLSFIYIICLNKRDNRIIYENKIRDILDYFDELSKLSNDRILELYKQYQLMDQLGINNDNYKCECIKKEYKIRFINDKGKEDKF